MLKQGTLFKDFHISASVNNTSVTFTKNAPLLVSVKNDNFASQVQILDNEGITDFFDYKYITFDNSAVFEITDCIKNEKYTTLFIQYLSNITFDAADTNFRVDAVSANTLQKLGLDINDFLKILGNNVTIDTSEITSHTNSAQAAFIYAIKLRFSEIPKNLNYRFTGNKNQVTSVDTDRGTGRNLIHNQSYINQGKIPSSSADFTQFDNAATVIIPIPVRGEIGVTWGNTNSPYAYDMIAFIRTLDAIISDLTLTAEITMLTSGSLVSIESDHIAEIRIADMQTHQTIILANGVGSDLMLKSFRVTNHNIYEASGYPSQVIDSALCILTEGFHLSAQFLCGTWEVLNYFKLYLDTKQTNRALLSLSMLNNTLDISQLRHDYILIKRQSQSLRFYIDYERNVYEDVQTTFEFARSAYSNYDAYQKANIELTNRQSLDTLRQQQKQQRDIQTVNSVHSGFNTALNAIGNIASGNFAGAAMGVLGGAGNIAADEIKFNMSRQNETANQKLSAAQAHERARSVIVPSSELHGSLSMLNAFTSMLAAQGKTSLYTLNYIVLNPFQLACLEKYIFENVITDKIINMSQLTKPAWQTLHNFYQVKIANRSALNNRKDLIIFVE